MPLMGAMEMQSSMEKQFKTSYKELTFAQIEKGTWRIFSQWEGETHPSAVGKLYASKIELLCDIDRYARECGL